MKYKKIPMNIFNLESVQMFVQLYDYDVYIYDSEIGRSILKIEHMTPMPMFHRIRVHVGCINNPKKGIIHLSEEDFNGLYLLYNPGSKKAIYAL